jgi:hypothetical protein
LKNFEDVTDEMDARSNPYGPAAAKQRRAVEQQERKAMEALEAREAAKDAQNQARLQDQQDAWTRWHKATEETFAPAMAKGAFRACVAVFDEDGSGRLTCGFTKCLGDPYQTTSFGTGVCSPNEERQWEGRGRRDAMGEVHWFEGPKPKRCLQLPLKSGASTGVCDTEGPLNIDFRKGQMMGLRGEYACEGFRYGRDGDDIRCHLCSTPSDMLMPGLHNPNPSYPINCRARESFRMRAAHAESAPTQPAPNVAVVKPDCTDYWNWCFGQVTPDPDACRSYAAYCR